jgi:hypothetical protein
MEQSTVKAMQQQKKVKIQTLRELRLSCFVYRVTAARIYNHPLRSKSIYSGLLTYQKIELPVSNKIPNDAGYAEF